MSIGREKLYKCWFRFCARCSRPPVSKNLPSSPSSRTLHQAFAFGLQRMPRAKSRARCGRVRCPVDRRIRYSCSHFRPGLCLTSGVMFEERVTIEIQNLIAKNRDSLKTAYTCIGAALYHVTPKLLRRCFSCVLHRGNAVRSPAQRVTLINVFVVFSTPAKQQNNLPKRTDQVWMQYVLKPTRFNTSDTIDSWATWTKHSLKCLRTPSREDSVKAFLWMSNSVARKKKRTGSVLVESVPAISWRTVWDGPKCQHIMWIRALRNHKEDRPLWRITGGRYQHRHRVQSTK